MSDQEVEIFIKVMFLMFFMFGSIGYIWNKMDAKKYMPFKLTDLMKSIHETPIREFDYHVFHGKATGPMAGPSFKNTSSLKYTKLLFFKNFIIITAAGYAVKIKYADAKIDFEVSNSLLMDFYGNIVIQTKGLVYNIYAIKSKEDFDCMKNIIEKAKLYQ